MTAFFKPRGIISGFIHSEVQRVQMSRSFSRRPILGMAAEVLLSTTSVAWAQGAWPNKPVKVSGAKVD